MAPQHYLRVSGITLDRCSEHGTWLDHRHALRLLELLEAGQNDALIMAARQHNNDAGKRSERVGESRSHKRQVLVENDLQWDVLNDLLDWSNFD